MSEYRKLVWDALESRNNGDRRSGCRKYAQSFDPPQTGEWAALVVVSRTRC